MKMIKGICITYFILKSKIYNLYLYNMATLALKGIFSVFYSTIIGLLPLILLIIIMILLQLLIINILYKKENFNWSVKFKKLLLINTFFIITWTSLYIILHSNLFLSNFTFFFSLAIIFIMLRSLQLLNLTYSKLKIIFLFWILGSITRNFSILIYSLLLNPDNLLLLSVKFNLLNYIFPIFFFNFLHFYLFDSTINFSFLKLKFIKCDETIADILRSIKRHYETRGDQSNLQKFMQQIYKNLIDDRVEHITLNSKEAKIFRAFCHVPIYKSLAYKAWENHDLLMSIDRTQWSKHIHGNHLHRVEVCNFNSIFKHFGKNISVFKRLHEINIDEKDWIELKTTNDSEIDIFILNRITDIYNETGIRYIVKDDQFATEWGTELVFLGTMSPLHKTYVNYGEEGKSADCLSKLLIFERTDYMATEDMSFDYANLAKDNDLIFRQTVNPKKLVRYNWDNNGEEYKIFLRPGGKGYPTLEMRGKLLHLPNLKDNEVYYYIRGNITYPFTRYDPNYKVVNKEINKDMIHLRLNRDD